MDERKPIFYDEDRSRWRNTRRALEVAGALFTIVLVTFFFTIINRVDLPDLLLPSSGRPGLHAVAAAASVKADLTKQRRRGRRRRIADLGKVPVPAAYAPERRQAMPPDYDPLRIAFYVSWDPSSFASLLTC
jgi:hypothetical protein